MSENGVIFNRLHVKQHRNRMAEQFSGFDFLFLEGAERLAERLEDTSRTFPLALDLGCHTGQLASVLNDRGGISTLVQCDLSQAMVARTPGLKLVADEEFLPFADNSFDLVMSSLSLHWVNDLPGTLIQIHKALKPGGIFFASLLGGETLKELRQATLAAEMESGSGISPRVSPFIDVKDAGALLQRAGFSMPVTDSDAINVTYGEALSLFQDLHYMGEGNKLLRARKQFTPRSTLLAIAKKYQAMFSDHHGEIKASFDIITLTGMKP